MSKKFFSPFRVITLLLLIVLAAPFLFLLAGCAAFSAIGANSTGESVGAMVMLLLFILVYCGVGLASTVLPVALPVFLGLILLITITTTLSRSSKKAQKQSLFAENDPHADPWYQSDEQISYSGSWQ